MKIQTIRVKEDLNVRLNRLKYQFGYKNMDQLIRRLIELATPQLNNNTPSKELSVEEKELAEKEGKAGGIE